MFHQQHRIETSPKLYQVIRFTPKCAFKLFWKANFTFVLSYTNNRSYIIIIVQRRTTSYLSAWSLLPSSSSSHASLQFVVAEDVAETETDEKSDNTNLTNTQMVRQWNFSEWNEKVNQNEMNCRWSRVVHGSLFLDPTRPGETLTRPDPTHDCRQKVWPDPIRPAAQSFLHMYIFDWIIIY